MPVPGSTILLTQLKVIWPQGSASMLKDCCMCLTWRVVAAEEAGWKVEVSFSHAHL